MQWSNTAWQQPERTGDMFEKQKKKSHWASIVLRLAPEPRTTIRAVS